MRGRALSLAAATALILVVAVSPPVLPEERISSAGTLRKLDLSRELAALWERTASRCDRESGRLGPRADACEAQLAVFYPGESDGVRKN